VAGGSLMAGRVATGDSFLTVKEAATRLRVSPMTVYRLIYAKRLTPNNVGTGPVKPRLRISEQALAEFMAGTVMS
jgi:excisionase family DNA binding protein